MLKMFFVGIVMIVLKVALCAGPKLQTYRPSFRSTQSPSPVPTNSRPSCSPSILPTRIPTPSPTIAPTCSPSFRPTLSPTWKPSVRPSVKPSVTPTFRPTLVPSRSPSRVPTAVPTRNPSASPSFFPTRRPTANPTRPPTRMPTVRPTISLKPTISPTRKPSLAPSISHNPSYTPSVTPTLVPVTFAPSKRYSQPMKVLSNVNCLSLGSYLSVGECLPNYSNSFYTCLNYEGDICMYKNITDDLSKTWCLGLQVPRGESPGRLNLTGDGNLIVVTKGYVAYFGTNLPSAARRLVIQNDGTFALYNSNNEQDWSCRKLANSCPIHGNRDSCDKNTNCNYCSDGTSLTSQPTMQSTSGVTNYRIDTKGTGYIVSGVIVAIFTLIALKAYKDRENITLFSLSSIIIAFVDFGTDALFLDQIFATLRNLQEIQQEHTQIYVIANDIKIASCVVLGLVALGNLLLIVIYNRKRKFILFHDAIHDYFAMNEPSFIHYCGIIVIIVMMIPNLLIFCACLTNYELTYEFFCYHLNDHRKYVITALGLIIEDFPQLVIQLYWISKAYTLNEALSTLSLVSLSLSAIRLVVFLTIKIHSLWILVKENYRPEDQVTLRRIIVLLKCFCLLSEIPF